MLKTLVRLQSQGLTVARCRAVVWFVLYAMARKSKADKSSTEKGKSIELEGKRKSDNAWCECQVSLGSAEPSGTFLNVHFASFKNDQTDTIMQEDEVMARLRVRSTSLSDGECLQVKEGEAIVASQKTQSGRCHFFDAEVEKVQRVKHSNKVFCRCTFEIKWLEGKMKGETVTVPASSIRRLVHENINNHPVISAFFKAVQAANMPSMSLQLPSAVPHEDSDIESDLHDRLEQQIEEIAKLADNSENAATEEMPSRRTKVNVNKRHRGKVPSSNDITVYNNNANEKVVSRTSARKRNRVSSEAVCKDAVTVRAATLLHSEKRPRLSPLAARAALAAAVWNLPLGKQNESDLNQVFVAKKQDSVDPSEQNALRKQLDKVSLKLSDTYFDTRSQGNYNGLRKRAASSARGKSSKRSRANNFHEYQDNAFNANRDEHDGAYKKHLRNASADHSMVGTPQLISVSTKQETSSDIASTVKEPSATAGVAISLRKQIIQKRHKGASKEVSSTRSRKRSAGVMPVRSSPRFQIKSQSECNRQQPLLSEENTETGKKESVVTENVQREQSGRSSTARVKGRMPTKGRKQLKASANEPELAALSADSSEAKHQTFSEAIEGSTQDNGCEKAFKAASVESREVKHSSIFTKQFSQQAQTAPQGKAYNTAGRASKAALVGAKKGKHLLKGAITEIITEVRKRPKENGISDDKKASRPSLVEPKNQLEEVPSLDHMTSNSTEVSLKATKKRIQNEPESKKMDSKVTTSISRKLKKTVTSTRQENSNGMDNAEAQPPNRKRTPRVTCPHEGENLRKGGTRLYENLRAQPQSIMRAEKKHASRKSVVRSSPRLRFLPRTRSQKNTTGGHEWVLEM